MKHEARYVQIARALLDWFAENAQDLPWRRTKDPYAIWVSELMLQQTQVRTVVPYYERFLSRFPTVAHLARARVDTVIKLWEGLGYYSRARNLHAGAQQIVTRFGGHLPATREELLILPGIGRYTAGAIASIAFGQREPLVDGNVTRVLCRIFRIQGNPKEGTIQKRIWALAETLVPDGQAGPFNQALMELGREVCRPRKPDCENCPLHRLCEARQHGEQNSLPVRTGKRPLPFYTVAVGVIYRSGRILIDKRRSEGLLGGLWEFPGGKKQRGESLEAALRREVREELAITVQVGRLLTTVDHAYSHFRVRIHAFECTYVSGTPQCIACAAFKWVRPQDLGRYAFPAANKRIIATLRSR